MSFNTDAARTAVALARVAEIWRARLDDGWMPPDGSAFPWAQVRLSLAALLPGMAGAGGWGHDATDARLAVTLILAGNTPLLAWSPLVACLLAGASPIRVKLSRDESVWTRLFVESLRDADPGLAARISLHDFPGEDERTYALLADADAVIVYGSDVAIAALRVRTPPGVPFFGYGHAVSLGLLTDFGRHGTAARGFARDVLMYNQQGCLSPHIIYGLDVEHFGTATLPAALAKQAKAWDLSPVTDAASARAVREARDTALFAGHHVEGDSTLRWTVITTTNAVPFPAPVGGCVIYVSPLTDHRDASERETMPLLQSLLEPVKGIVSCVGVSGRMSDVSPFCWRSSLLAAGMSRFCKPGEMQTPPLDWQNGGRDLLAELRSVQRRRRS